jgi:hypothetical protein
MVIASRRLKDVEVCEERLRWREDRSGDETGRRSVEVMTK